MAWVRLDDHFDEHDKFVTVGPDGGWLFIRSLAYCNRQETDGAIPAAMLNRIGSDFGTGKRKKLAALLVEAGMWHVKGHGCSRCPDPIEGWQVHDYADYQPTRAKKDADRAEARDRMARARAAKKERGETEQTTGSADVRTEHSPNGARSSVNPVPGPVTVNPEGQDHGDADAPHGFPRIGPDFTDNLVRWARTQGHVRNVKSRADVTRWCLDLAAEELDGNRYLGAATQLVIEWVEHACGEPLATSARKHLVRLLNAEGAPLVFKAMEASVLGGAGLRPEFADDPQALVRYANACVARWRSEGNDRKAG